MIMVVEKMNCDDIIYEIIRHLDSGYKSYSLVCKQWYKMIRPQVRRFIEKECSLLITVLLTEQFTAEELDKEILMKNIHVNMNTFELLEKYGLMDEWCVSALSLNSSTTWETVLNHPHIKWDYRVMSSNPNITWEIIRDNPNIGWDYVILINHPNITWDIIQNNRDKFPTLGIVNNNPNITWEIIQSIQENNIFNRWWYMVLSVNPNITWEIMRDNPSLPGQTSWSFVAACENPNITWDIVKDNQEIFDSDMRSYALLSSNPNITWDIIQENPDKHWCYKWMSQILTSL